MTKDTVLPRTTHLRAHSSPSLRAFKNVVPNRKLATALQILVLLIILQYSIFKSISFLYGGASLELQRDQPVVDHKPNSTNSSLKQWQSAYERAIMDPDDTFFNRSACPTPTTGRYDYLKQDNSTQPSTFRKRIPPTKPKYFFALDLFNCAPLLPRLIGSIVEAIRFLGPENCALSIVEGRSKDGTGEILELLRPSMEKLGVLYFLQTSEVAPLGGEVDRMVGLAELRNDALKPLVAERNHFDPDTTVVFLNDIAVCQEDILELIHQRFLQKADMTCAMDWITPGDGDAMFYDVYVSRTNTGDTFFNIPPNGTWDNWKQLFWNDDETSWRFHYGIPFQVFACWNGVTAFTAKPIMDGSVRFRGSLEGEPYAGEPTLLCKDMTSKGYGKIAVVPSVNVAYSDQDATLVKEYKGYVSDWTGREITANSDTMITWRPPPAQVKWAPNWETQDWKPWSVGLKK